uniref:Uncharacterized protein n=1 Tax=Oryza barthii TaxID=65489 RepID=A0A0D3GP38_9ORYZ
MALSFAVRRRAPELVAPAAPTPRETKRLSDVDDPESLRWQVPVVFVYRARRWRARRPSAAAADPVDTIRRALAAALVPYYPFAGRLREVEGRKLVVDCTVEGVMFVEADADVRVADLEAAGLRAPFPCMDQLLFDVDGSAAVLGTPLLLIQKTVTAEYVRSVADTLVMRGRPAIDTANLLLLSDVRLAGFHRVDFGWGEPVYGGPSHAWFGVSYLIAVKNGAGEDGVAVPVVLPAAAMERFTSEIERLRKGQQRVHFRVQTTSRI